MGIKRKVEEKKMSMNKNIARLAVTAGLTAALSFGGVMAPVTMAFAEGGATTSTNSITINKNEKNGDVKYKAYQIFKADVINEANKKVVSNVDWVVPEAVQVEIINVIEQSDNYATTSKKLPTTGATAQNVADWLAANIQDAGAVDNGALLNKIASLVEATNPVKPKDAVNDAFDANIPVSFDESGYYLFLTDSDSISASTDASKKANTGTSPIFAIVGGDPVIVTEKTSIPTVNKAVLDDDGSWTFNGDDILTAPNKGADSAIGDYVKYRLVGTVANNINTFGTYEYTFTDKLPETMTPKYTDAENSTTPNVTVKIDNTTVVNGFEPAYQQQDHVFTVHFDDLKNCKDKDGHEIPVTATSRVTVEYEAMLDPQIICNDDGTLRDIYKDNLLGKAQKNTVKLEYSNNPRGEGIGTTADHCAYDYTYGIDVKKVGSDNEAKGLEGVEFTLQENGDASNFIKADGTKTADSKQAKLKTDADGKINVVGLDEGTYTLKEVTPKPGYNNSASKGVTFTIARGTLKQDGSEVILDENSVNIHADNGVVKANSATVSTGKLSFTIVDQKGSGLPLTGLNGVTFTWIAGGAVLCIGVAHLIRSRKQAEESEQE